MGTCFVVTHLGGGATPLFFLYGDVPLGRVFGDPSLLRKSRE